MQKRLKVAETVETIETPNIKLLRRAIYQVPSIASRNLIREAIHLVNAADCHEKVRVTWQMSPLGIQAHRATGDSYRLYAISPSISKLDRKNCGMRHVAQHNRVIPIDIENCHPTIIADQTENEVIQTYATNKDSCRNNIATHYNVTEDDAKKLLLRLTYNGTAKAWAKEFAPKCSTHAQFALAYQRAMASYANQLVKERKVLVECIKSFRDPRDGSKRKNVRGCLVSYETQKVERKMTNAMRRVHRDVQSILHDEVMFTRNENEDESSIRELERECTDAVQKTVKNATCAAKISKLPDWFDPERPIFFEQYKTFSACMHDFAESMSKLQSVQLTTTGRGEDGDTTVLVEQIEKGGFITPPKQLGMNLSFNKAMLVEEIDKGGVAVIEEDVSLLNHEDGEMEDFALDLTLREAKRQEKCIELLSTSIYYWWFDHFFAQSTSDSGYIYEFTFTDTGLIDEFYVYNSRDMLTKFAPVKKMMNEWLKHPQHRMIAGVGFYPRGDGKAGYVNTWSGLPHTPLALSTLVDADLARVRTHLSHIHFHWRVIMANGSDTVYNYLRKWYSYVTQGRGKTRVFLQFLSVMYQGGKSAFNVDLMSKVLGKYFYAPNCGLDQPNGLLGRFTYPYMNRLLICADELGEMIFNKKGRSDLRCWLTRAKGEYKKECCPPVYIDDHANLVANTNEILATHTETSGDCRNAIFAIDERYTKDSAEKGLIVDGEPMTMERRRTYFAGFYQAIGDPLTIAAFTHELLNEECAHFDFQNIPETDIRLQMKEVYDERSWVYHFLYSWANHEIFWHEDGAGGCREVRTLTPHEAHSATFVYTGLSTWASRNNDRVPLQKCRSHQQLGIQLQDYIKNETLSKRASNGRTLYKLSQSFVEAAAEAKASEMNDF